MFPRSPFRRRSSATGREDGYILLTLMMIAAIVVLLLATVLPAIKQQVQRDQEEELIHRAVQYSRAIRKYYKKFGRYPTKIEDLDDTNHQRFLRRHYKDPINGQDFKLLHFGEVQMAFGPGIAGGVAPGANAMGSVPAPKDPNQSGNASNTSDTNSSINSSSDSSQDSSSSNPAPLSPGGQTFGGGPIVGVASTSKKKSIRVFNKKDHYNQWQFIYDPGSDRGGLLNSPVQPQLQNPAAAPAGNPNQGQSPQQGAPGVPVLTPGGSQQNNPQIPQQPPDMNQQQ
jgi:type II secretory pathway pseudopilin PulG